MTDIKELINGVTECECGKSHLCPIEHIEISDGALLHIPHLCDGYEKILLIADKNTAAACGNTVFELISDKIARYLVLSDNGPVLIPNEDAIAEIEGAMDGNDLIIGVGSGVINDLCKHVSFLHDIPYYIVATAPSMDGYASVGAALILGGMKVTLNARPPKGIIADTTVLSSAPADMIKAGWGDIIGKFSCLNDWRLAALINGEYFCCRVYDITLQTTRRVAALADGIAKGETHAVGALMEALVTVGIAMSYVGNSRPASGSEHHLSHFFEITGILDKKPYFSHGTDVVYSAVVTAKLREYILKNSPQYRPFGREEWEKNIRRIYSTAADGVIALQDKVGFYLTNDGAAVTARWNEICNILREAPSSDEMLSLLSRAGLDYNEFLELYGEDKIRDACLYSKDLKDRYSVLWLYYQFFRNTA